MPRPGAIDERHMKLALKLAERAYGQTSPNPMVGAVIVRRGQIVGRGWHHCAGEPHAEIEALRDAEKRGNRVDGATMYVTLEPCCTHGRTPPCTEAIIRSRIKRVVVAATDPNPQHSGRGFSLLRSAGIDVASGLLQEEAARLNEVFNHWIVHQTPFVTVKAAMTLDGKIATATGQSKWITGPRARAIGMRLRQGCGAIVVGLNTVVADDPALTLRGIQTSHTQPWRIVLDSLARIPANARLLSDEHASRTIVVVTDAAPKIRVATLRRNVEVWTAPASPGVQAAAASPCIDLRWLLRRLAKENVTSVLVEGGGEVNASFLFGGHAQRVAFFYAPKIIGGRSARKGVAGEGIKRLAQAIQLSEVEWSKVGPDLLLQARIAPRQEQNPIR